MARGHCGRHRPCRADDDRAYKNQSEPGAKPGKQDVLPGGMGPLARERQREGRERRSKMDITVEDICAMARWFGGSPMQLVEEWRELGEADRAEIYGLFAAQVYAE